MANFSQRLKHGKALCGKVFSGFVETFNALVDFKDNLKGDDDVAPGANGHLHLDRTDPKHPVLRCRGCGGTSGQVQPTSQPSGRYAISSISVDLDPATASITFANPYYRAGGKTYTGGTSIANVTLPAIVALRVDITGSTPSAQLVSYASLAALQSAEADEDYYIHPLYKLSSTGSVECDFRIGPDSSQWEFGGTSA